MKLKKWKAKYFFFALMGIVLISALTTLFVHLHRINSIREEAELLLARKEFLAAAEKYMEIEDAESRELCLQLYDKQCYEKAEQQMLAGDFDKARQGFRALGNYRDCPELLDSCDYLEARYFAEQENYTAARELLLKIPGYEAADELMESCNAGIYDQAMALVMGGDYAGAGALWQIIEGYEDTDKLLFRAERMTAWLERDIKDRLLRPEKRFKNGYFKNAYVHEDCYIVASEDCGEDCRFFIYYPGGGNEEMNIDFLYYYLMNPAPNSVGIFMRKNGIDDMQAKNSRALELLDRAAAECGVFAHDIMVFGSSMGAYPAMHSPRYSMEELGIKVDCVLSLDAGVDWNTVYRLQEDEAAETAETGTEFYLLESPGVGMNRQPIAMLVNEGIPVTVLSCWFDEHERITADAMGLGLIHWALGDRSDTSILEKINIYTLTKLEPNQ